MSTQYIFLFWASPLFYDSISRLLIHPKIKFVGSSSNYSLASSDVISKKPNTIIIEDTGNQRSEMVTDFLNTVPWSIKIIILGFNDNELVVYHHAKHALVQTEDLLHMVLSEFG